MINKHKWEPLYCFRVSPFQWVKILLYYILSLLCIFFSVLGFSTDNPVVGFIGIVCVIYIIFLIYRKSGKVSRIIKKLSEKNIEFYEKINSTNIIYIKQANGRLGLFDVNSEIIVIEPTNVAVIISDNFFLMENAELKWGVYNRKLRKLVLPFEYDGASINNTGNIMATQGNIQYEFSPYGTLMR